MSLRARAGSRSRTGGRVGEKRSQDLRAIYIIGGCLLVLVLFVVALNVTKPPELDPLTGCPADNRPPPAHTIILVDETDTLSRPQLSFVRALVMTEYNWLLRGGRLTVRNILADPDDEQDITVCRVASKADSWGIVENRRFVDAQFKKTAGKKLDDLIAKLAKAPLQTDSPILESASAVMDRGDFGSNVGKRRLVIYSDFAQHSPLLDQYGHKGLGVLSYEKKEELDHDMSGVEVRLHYLKRGKLSYIQTERHRAFWRNFFEGQKAKVVLGAPQLLLGEPPNRPTWTQQPD